MKTKTIYQVTCTTYYRFRDDHPFAHSDSAIRSWEEVSSILYPTLDQALDAIGREVLEWHKNVLETHTHPDWFNAVKHFGDPSDFLLRRVRLYDDFCFYANIFDESESNAKGVNDVKRVYNIDERYLAI